MKDAIFFVLTWVALPLLVPVIGMSIEDYFAKRNRK